MTAGGLRPPGGDQQLVGRATRQSLPERLRHERHDRVQQAERAVERVHEHRARRLAVIPVLRETRLDRLEVPVRELVPHESSCGLGVVVEPQSPWCAPPRSSARCSDGRGRARRRTRRWRRRDARESSDPHATDDPGRSRTSARTGVAADVRQQEAADVPELRDEVPARGERLLEIVGIEDDVDAKAHARRPRCSAAGRRRSGR